MKNFTWLFFFCWFCWFITPIQAGGYWRINLTKKGSELKTQIEEAINKKSSVEIRKPGTLRLLPYWMMGETDLCLLEIIHPQEVMVVSYNAENKEQFDQINQKLKILLEPYKEIEK